MLDDVIEATAEARLKKRKTQTLFCEAGQHSFERETKRGVKPRNCPQHQPKIVTERKQRRLTPEHKAKMKAGRERKRLEAEKTASKALRDTVKRLTLDAARLEAEDDLAYTRLQDSKSDTNFDGWLKTNTNLLNTLTALKAHEMRINI
jgi:hypothetical protein